jgi:hypothetical protein
MAEQPRELSDSEAHNGEPLAIIHSYSDFYQALRTRADQLAIPRETLDIATGLPSSKPLSQRTSKHIGVSSWPLILGALAVELWLVEDAEALKKIRPLLVKRELAPLKLAVSRENGRHAKKHNLISKRFLRKIAHLGGKARARKLSPARRSAIARKAGRIGGKARWQKPRGVEIMKGRAKEAA